MPQHMQATHSHSKLLMAAKCHRPQVSNEVVEEAAEISTGTDEGTNWISF